MNFRYFKHTVQSTFRKIIVTSACLLLIASGISGCSKNTKTVVVYTSVDQVYSEKLFKAYEKETGVTIKPVYDIEAQKTVGLVNRLISEKNKPQADVFWNGEILQTIALKENGVLEKSSPENEKNLPSSFVDKDKMWFGFGGRARVLIYNRTLISKSDLPKTLEEFAKGPNVSKSGLAYPIFGTTATHAAALYSFWGPEKAKAYYQDLKNSGIVILDGNGVVKDYVSQKKLVMGLTDTDDALSEIAVNKDLDIAFLDQGESGMGNLVIPNTVAKIKGGPNPTQADLFINYLLSSKVERKLVDDGWIQIPVNSTVKANPAIELLKVKIMATDFSTAYKDNEMAKTDLTKIFIR